MLKWSNKILNQQLTKKRPMKLPAESKKWTRDLKEPKEREEKSKRKGIRKKMMKRTKNLNLSLSHSLKKRMKRIKIRMINSKYISPKTINMSQLTRKDIKWVLNFYNKPVKKGKRFKWKRKKEDSQVKQTSKIKHSQQSKPSKINYPRITIILTQ